MDAVRGDEARRKLPPNPSTAAATTAGEERPLLAAAAPLEREEGRERARGEEARQR